MKRVVVDIESVGLHGEGFAVGYVVQEEGKNVNWGCFACPADTAQGDASDREWVTQNVTLPPVYTACANPREVRDCFWQLWTKYKAEGAELWTDCGWPVEANFLSACVADDPETRKWEGPYPLLDVAVMFSAVGWNPLGAYPRENDELPAHNPLYDARQSARLLLLAENALSQAGFHQSEST